MHIIVIAITITKFFFIRNHFIRNLHEKGQKIKKLDLLKTKSQRNFLSNIYIIANYRELGNRFHSLQSNAYELCVIPVASVSYRSLHRNFNVFNIPSSHIAQTLIAGH